MILTEILAIGLVIAARASGFLPLPGWPFLLLIAAGFGSKLFDGWTRFERDAPPSSAVRIMVLAALIGIGYQFFTIFVEGPVLEWLFNEPESPPPVGGLVGNVAALLGFLVIVTIFSVGEELAFRGYLLTRIREWTGGSWVGTLVALVLSSAAFGAVHNWQNLPGVTGTAISGLVFGIVFLAARGDVRAPIVSHLATNVTAVVLAFLGLFIS